ncbi:NADH-quinone oxidoreductase subunit NuoH [Chloroflexota bacterium]
MSHFFVFATAVIVFALVTVIIFIWLERRLLGRFQVRYGPNRAGPFGLLQPIADVVKILTKEDIIPAKGDKLVFWLAPIVAFTPALLVFAVVPFWDGALLADLNIGILYVLAIGSVTSIGVFMAGWSSNNKYSLIAAMRDAAQLVSYEIPLVLSVVGVVLIAGSLSLTDIVNAQGVPFLLLQPMGFFIYFTASLAEINRCPFDMVEADSELVSGYNIEYSGMKFAMFFLTEYTEAVFLSVIVTTLFLGGWRGPLLPPFAWFLIKVFAVFFLVVWIRATIMRLRMDQVMAFAWKFLLPLALINLLVTSAQIVFWPGAPSWSIMLINIAVMIFLIILLSRNFYPGGKKIAA